MRVARIILICAVSFWLLGACQQALPHRISIFGARPDFLLVFLTAMGMQLTRAGGAVLGFAGGVLHGALAGANLTHYVISRALSTFALSWVRSAGFEPSAVVAGFYAATHTIFAQLILMFLTAPRDIPNYLGDTMGTAMYNGVLAIPLYALLKRVVGRPPR